MDKGRPAARSAAAMATPEISFALVPGIYYD